MWKKPEITKENENNERNKNKKQGNNTQKCVDNCRKSDNNYKKLLTNVIKRYKMKT